MGGLGAMPLSARSVFFGLAWCLCLIGLMSPLTGFAWSSKGHAVIAQQALQLLSPAEQEFFEQHAVALLRHDSAKKWRKPLSDYSQFSQAAVWPDTRRKATLQNLFNRFAKTAVPASLKALSGFSTSKWHYVNASYWPTSSSPDAHGKLAQCQLKPAGQMSQVWPQLLLAYDESEKKSERGLIVAFLSHLLADAYQPIHGFSGVKDDCQHDAGGNRYCLKRASQLGEDRSNSNGKCLMSLHYLWDEGFGVFDKPMLRKEGEPLISPHRIEVAPILQSSSHYAQFVYSVPEETYPDSHYQQKGAMLVKKQAKQAAHDLAALLKYLYGRSLTDPSVYRQISSGQGSQLKL